MELLLGWLLEVALVRSYWVVLVVCAQPGDHPPTERDSTTFEADHAESSPASLHLKALPKPEVYVASGGGSELVGVRAATVRLPVVVDVPHPW
jgi:hypothetical protein